MVSRKNPSISLQTKLKITKNYKQSYLELEISIIQSKKVNYIVLARKKKKINKRDQERSSQVLNLSIR